MGKRKRLCNKNDLDSEVDDMDSLDENDNSGDLYATQVTESLKNHQSGDDDSPRDDHVTEKKKFSRPRHATQDRFRKELFSVHSRQGACSSVKSVLIQSLISKDKALLDSILNVMDLLVIRRTISELPSSYVEEFVHQLSSRCYETPLRIRMLGPWLRELLRQHITFCHSAPSIRKKFKSLYQYAALRLRNHYSSVKLQGELNVLTYLAYRRIEESRVSDQSLNCKKPLLVVREAPHTAEKLNIVSVSLPNR